MIELLMGTDQDGHEVRLPIDQAPHVLVAGATGMGKSSQIHAMIADMAKRYTPDQVYFQMIDPKRVELAVWDTLPHVRGRSWKMDEIVWRLGGMCALMAENYAFLEKGGYRKVDPDARRHVIVIDEMAPLMLGSEGKAITDMIASLTQLGRAAGIHVIAATQHPVVEVIATIIKANMPTRLALGTTNASNSRVILDEDGAEKLRNPGDMFARLPGRYGLVRLKGGYVSDAEIAALLP